MEAQFLTIHRRKLDKPEDIVKGCIKGNAAAQEQLYKTYASKMFGVCMYMTKDRMDAEEVMQEGFIKVYTNIKQYKNKGSFEGWMRRIFVNTALERYRKKSHMYAVNGAEDIAEDVGYNHIIDQISAQDLMVFIHELTPQYRMVFSLYAIEGYSHAEIGKMLNVSVGTSKSNLSRARKILQDKVIKLYGDDLAINKRISC